MLKDGTYLTHVPLQVVARLSILGPSELVAEGCWLQWKDPGFSLVSQLLSNISPDAKSLWISYGKIAFRFWTPDESLRSKTSGVFTCAVKPSQADQVVPIQCSHRPHITPYAT